MSFAVRNDFSGFRAVNDSADCTGEEFFSREAPSIKPSPITREQVEASRLRAYADPITGSDRYFAEAQRESMLGNPEAAEAAKALGLTRFAEIQAANPWPAD